MHLNRWVNSRTRAEAKVESCDLARAGSGTQVSDPHWWSRRTIRTMSSQADPVFSTGNYNGDPECLAPPETQAPGSLSDLFHAAEDDGVVAVVVGDRSVAFDGALEGRLLSV